MNILDDSDYYCPKCGLEIVVEFNDFHTSVSSRYIAYCGCREPEPECPDDYNYRSNYKAPTLGDLLRQKLSK